ncbi:MAG: hypothetical protein IMW89_07505 [Ktedonobacteraceae bacterium]|nr:hypothetical protein [Ktedonobacteraceae bacterium]
MDSQFLQENSYTLLYENIPGLEEVVISDAQLVRQFPNAVGFLRPVRKGEVEAMALPQAFEKMTITHVFFKKIDGELYKTYYTAPYMQKYQEEHPLIDTRETVMFVPGLPATAWMIMDLEAEKQRGSPGA